MGKRTLLFVSLAIVVLAAAVWFGRTPIAFATMASTYAAKQMCSCLKVSGRTAESCLGEFPPEYREALRIEETETQVTATAFGVITSQAAYDPAYGCTPR